MEQENFIKNMGITACVHTDFSYTGERKASVQEEEGRISGRMLFKEFLE